MSSRPAHLVSDENAPGAAAASPFVRAAALLVAVLAIIVAGCGGNGDADLAATGPALDAEVIGGDPETSDEAEDAVSSEPLPPPDLPSPAPAPSPSGSPEPAPSDVRRLCFTPREDCIRVLLSFMQSETVGIDVAVYHLYDHRVSQVLLERHLAGVPVRVIGDRHAYTAHEKQAREMNFLASNGVPVRTNRHRGIIHHKSAMLHGLGLVVHGSLNFTSAGRKLFNSRLGQNEWADELMFFTTNPQAFARFKERFERMWANTGDGRQAFQPFFAGMALPNFEQSEQSPPTTCYEDPRPSPRPLPDDPELRLCFVPDQHCNLDVLVPLIKAETRRLDLIVFRVTSFEISDPLVAKVKAGLPVRIILERGQYNHPNYPNETKVINNLWAANANGNLRLKATAHAGQMHMKSLITPDVATWGSGNISRSSSKSVRGCQSKYYQDEDLMATTDPALVARMQARFEEMWNSDEFADFDPSAAGSSDLADDVE